MDSLQRFVTAPEVERFGPATDEELSAFQVESGLSLPASAIQLYKWSNGLNINRLGLGFLPLEDVSKYLEGFQDLGIADKWGYFPFTEANDSNPYCICCRDPLAGKIVHVFHDDEASLDFRNLHYFLDALLTLVRESNDPIIDDLPAQYDITSDRTPEDAMAGSELLEIARDIPNDEPVLDQCLGFGLRLLPDSEFPEFVKLLDGSRQVREIALNRLNNISTPEAKMALEADKQNWRQFMTTAVASLRRAGITVEKVLDDAVLIQPNHIWLNMHVFYEENRDPNVFTHLIARAKYFISQKPG